MLNANERIVRIHIQKLPEGLYVATSNALQGLIVQGRTIVETIEIARDVARKLLEKQEHVDLPQLSQSFDYPLIV